MGGVTPPLIVRTDRKRTRSGRDALRELNPTRGPGEPHRAALEEVDPDPVFGVHRGGEFRVDRLAVGLLQAGQHLSDEADEAGFREQEVEGQDQLVPGGLKAACPGVRRVAVLHQGDEEVEIRVVASLQNLRKRPGREGIVFQIDEIDLPLGVLGDLGAGLGPQLGVAHGDHPGVIVSDPVHRPGAQAEDQADHAPGRVDPVRPGIGVPGEGHAGQAREEELFVRRPGNALDEDRHLLVAFAQIPGAAVGHGVRVQGAGVNEFHGAKKRIEPLLRRPLVGAVFAAVLAGKGVPEAVLQQAAGAGDDRRLAEVGQHVPELFHDLRRKPPGEEALLHLRELLVGDVCGAGELEAQAEEVVVHEEGEENIRADVEGVVGLENLREVDLARFREQYPPGDEHPRRLPADPPRTDETVPDGEEIVEREIGVHQAVELGMRSRSSSGRTPA